MLPKFENIENFVFLFVLKSENSNSKKQQFMLGLNKVQLIGNLGKDPELRKLDSGTSVVQFSLATTETYTNKEGQKVQQTEWHNIVMWRGLADVAEKYLHKGDPVYIEGKITNRSYNDKDGNKRYVSEIVASNMIMLPRAQSTEGNLPKDTTNYAAPSQQSSPGVRAESTPQPNYAEDAFDFPANEPDDLPF